MTVLDTWVYMGFFVFAVVLGIVAFFTLLASFFPVREVFIENKKGGRWVKAKEVPADKLHVVKKARRRKAIYGLSAFLALGLVGSYISWTVGSGEMAAQKEVSYERGIDSTIEKYNLFAEPLTRQEAVDIKKGKDIVRTVYAPNGESFETEFYFNEGFLFRGNRLTYRDESVQTKAAEWGVVLTPEAQLTAKAQGEVYDELESTYGLFLTDSQRTELTVPTVAPEHLTRYGTTPVVLSLGDGEFQRIDATLIWDGDEFQLVGAMDGDTLTELPEK